MTVLIQLTVLIAGLGESVNCPFDVSVLPKKNRRHRSQGTTERHVELKAAELGPQFRDSRLSEVSE